MDANRVTKENEVQVSTLKAEWGDKYQSNSELVDRAAAVFGVTKDQLDALRVAMGPGAAMKFMHNIGSKIGTEGEFITGDGQVGFKGMTPEQASNQIARNRADKTFSERFNSHDPKVRAEARAEMDRLHSIAYPVGA